MSNVVEIVSRLVQPILEEEKLELVDIEYKKEGAHWFLRVFVDKPEGGIDIEECGRVSERLSHVLDQADPINTPYFLEVSSPGAERPLRKEVDFRRSIGKHVMIKTYEPVDGQKEFEGKLESVDAEEIGLALNDGKTLTISFSKIASARQMIVFK
jgi:ribosome maturation factor RimP